MAFMGIPMASPLLLLGGGKVQTPHPHPLSPQGRGQLRVNRSCVWDFHTAPGRDGKPLVGKPRSSKEKSKLTACPEPAARRVWRRKWAGLPEKMGPFLIFEQKTLIFQRMCG
jgi:hypothetical protein